MHSNYGFLPDNTDLTSTEAFRDAVLGNPDFQNLCPYNLEFLYSSLEQWHDAFTHYHEIKLEYEFVTIQCISNGFYIDDLQFFPLKKYMAIDLGLA